MGGRVGRNNPCEYMYFPSDLQGPAEYCTEPAEDGSEYCADHDPDNWQPDWDDVRKDQLVGHFDCE